MPSRPGYVQTDMVMAIREDVRRKIVEQIPAGRLAMPEEVADAVAFLASEKAAYITGTNLVGQRRLAHVRLIPGVHRRVP